MLRHKFSRSKKKSFPESVHNLDQSFSAWQNCSTEFIYYVYNTDTNLQLFFEFTSSFFFCLVSAKDHPPPPLDPPR